jgi:hypothetical protein
MVLLRPVVFFAAVAALTACGGSDASGPPPVVAGPPATMTKTAGDNQTADPGQAVAIKPTVVVTDAQGLPVPGIVVTFSLGDGSGTINGAAPVTNAQGVASLGTWTLGTLPGSPNTVTASVGTLPTATFTATTTGTNPCTVLIAYPFGTTINGAFTNADCPSTDGSVFDFYSTTIPAAGAYTFSESSTAIDPYLFLEAANGDVVAENDDVSDVDTNAGMKVLIPAGSYVVAANTFDPKTYGPYSISSAAAVEAINNCELVFVTHGVTTSQNLATTDCLINGFYSDDVYMFLDVGQSVTATMNSTGFDAYLEIWSFDGIVASNDDVSATSTNAQVSFTAIKAAYYLIAPTTKLSGTPGITGAYTLTIQ